MGSMEKTLLKMQRATIRSILPRGPSPALSPPSGAGPPVQCSLGVCSHLGYSPRAVSPWGSCPLSSYLMTASLAVPTSLITCFCHKGMREKAVSTGQDGAFL